MPTIAETATAWRHRDFKWYEVRMSLSGIFKRSIGKTIGESIKNRNPQVISDLKNTLEHIREIVKTS